MSLASVRSSRGDSYEILIAAQWAVRMLPGMDIESVGIDSTELDVSGEFVTVDDVVVTFRERTKTYCQCKKNQTDFDSWKVSDLADDLKKAANQLTRDPRGTVVFYSTVPFGQIQKLREHSIAFSDSEAFQKSLSTNKSLATVANTLTTLWSEWIDTGNRTLFDLLRRISFEGTSSQAVLADQILRDLRMHVTGTENVYDALIAHLNRLKSRTTFDAATITSKPVLTRDALLQLIVKAGAVHTPPRTEADLLNEFKRVSAVGRAWRRDIGSQRIPRTSLQTLLEHIGNGVKRVLVSDSPGAGKTCLLLNLVDELEKQSYRAVIFVQGREFANAFSDGERCALGLPASVLDSVARMAEYRPVVVVLDSIDVLSLAREHSCLNYFLTLVDRLPTIPNVTVIVACRNFDLKYDRRLGHRQWDMTISVGPLDWRTEVVPLLEEWNVNADDLGDRLPVILTNPRMLAIFGDLVSRGRIPVVSTAQELTEQYLETCVSEVPALGEPALILLEALGQQMLTRRRLSIAPASANIPQQMKASLLSSEVIVENSSRSIEFGHQTLLDVLAVRAAIRSGSSLIGFVRAHAATPFLRPTIRSFLFYLRSTDPATFRSQVRAIIDAEDIAFHLKRLVAESFAEVIPTDDDWRLISHLDSRHPKIFQFFFFATRAVEWFDFFRQHWWSTLVAKKNVEGVFLFTRHLDAWVSTSSRDVLQIFLELLQFNWLTRDEAAGIISGSMHRWSDWTAPHLENVLSALIESASTIRIPLGHSLATWVGATGKGDELLWRFITGDITSEDVHYRRIGSKLRCGPDRLGPNRTFLEERMRSSEALLNLAIESIDCWIRRELEFNDRSGFRIGFLHETSYSQSHARYDMRHIDGGTVLLGAIESACLSHAATDTPWWRENVNMLLHSVDGGLRYIAIRAITKAPETNIVSIAGVLRDQTMLEYGGDYEMGRLLNSSFHLLGPEVTDSVLDQIMTLFEGYYQESGTIPDWIPRKRRDFLDWIPCCLRSPAASIYLDQLRNQYGDSEREPRIERSGGWVSPPFEYRRFVELSPPDVVRLLRQYSPGHCRENFLPAGGPDAVAAQLSEAASRYPVRFLSLLTEHWSKIDDRFGRSILTGVARHLGYRSGSVVSTGEWKAEEEPPLTLVVKLALDELDRHPASWTGTRAAAEVLEASSHVIEDDVELGRFTFHLVGVSLSPDPESEGNELAITASNSTRGVAAQAATIAAVRWEAKGKLIPSLLDTTLQRLAGDANGGVRFSILRYLPRLQQTNPALGWRLFAKATDGADVATWSEAEPCLYSAYHLDFERVSPYLVRLYQARALESWAHIACLATLSGHISTTDIKASLEGVEEESAWIGTSRVFATNAGLNEHQTACFDMLEWVLLHAPPSMNVASEVDHRLFAAESGIHHVPEPLLRTVFAFRSRIDQVQRAAPTSFLQWLEANAVDAPDQTLSAIEIMLNGSQWSEEATLFFAPSIFSALFQEAEEREDSDGGDFLHRVVAVQDVLLQFAGNTLYNWLKDAERA